MSEHIQILYRVGAAFSRASKKAQHISMVSNALTHLIAGNYLGMVGYLFFVLSIKAIKLAS